MSDWDFLHDMYDEGYSPHEIEAAAASGASPSEWQNIQKKETKNNWENLKLLRDSGQITADEFKSRKAELFK